MRQFYTGLIKWSDEEFSYFRVFWSWATNIGEAIDKMLKCAAQQQITNPKIYQFDPYNFEVLPSNAIASNNGETYFSEPTYSFPTEANYQLPYGVIASCLEGEHDISEIQVGYEVKREADGLIKLTALVEEDKLLPLYLNLLQVLPSIRVFWIKLQDDWEHFGKEELYVHEGLNCPQTIKLFLEQYHLDILLNGHLTLTSYTDRGETNVSIDEHRLIIVLGYDEELIDKICKRLEQYNFSKKSNLITVLSKIHHWHYKHPAGKARRDLTLLLRNKGFSYWEPQNNQ